MIAWCFQSAGILLGAHWAYAVLGWGGYWAWDPVENASLMPWLTGTAFLHSVMMQEKRGMMKVWNVWLVFSTFLLCILGTFMTRSGVVSSVHAFAQSSIGSWFVGFMIVVLGVCTTAFLKNRDYLRSDNQLDSMVSRESSFLFNNLILLVAGVAVLSSRCSRNGLKARRSASALRFSTRSISLSGCSCCFSPAWARFWPGGRLRSKA
jgi:cytochrome c-type biogenesis protein CcmF